MKLGIQVHMPARKVADVCKTIEDAGLDSAWSPGVDPGTGHYAEYAHMLSVTERIDIGGAIIPAFQASPLAHARAAIFLQEVYNGRFILGFGSQTKGLIRTQLGREYVKPAQMVKEVIEIVKAVTHNQGDRIQYGGEFFSINMRGSGASRRPTFPPAPIYLAAVNKLNLRVTGQVCDGLIGHPIYPPRYLRDFAIPRVELGLADTGRSRTDVDICAMPMTWIAETPGEREEAFHRGRVNLGNYFTTRAYWTFLELLGWSKVREDIEKVVQNSPYGGPFDTNELEKCIPDEIVEEVCLIGTPEEVRRKAKERYDGVADTLLFYMLGGGPDTSEGDPAKEETHYRVIDAFKTYER
jgi:alkanesulfonate monooxygenase SsuD/methylene tetrahydromethanopterin reductase-like flavin-dependent oxidoreductase (luciferase family)